MLLSSLTKCLLLSSLILIAGTTSFLGENCQFQDSSKIISSNEDPTSYKGYDEDVIIYTAHQEWPSRIYILDMDGTVLNYFHYDFYRILDVTVVNNKLYISDAFAPRVYKVNITTGDLELIIDDWTLYYFYDLSFDGNYFYVNEWDINRYNINGDKDGVASFDETVYGSAWDESYYWTLVDTGVIKCWNISSWPNITEIPSNSFYPPSTQCRGLWFDGQYFWTAESIDSALGYIYQFDYNGNIINQWIEPAFSGWGACVIHGGSDLEKHITTLDDNWNLISLPFNQSIDKTDIVVHYNEGNHPWSEAVTDGYISDFAFHWDRNSQSYDFADIFNPGYGYWLYCYKPCELWIENITITIDDFITTIENNWNIISVPFDEHVSKDEILVDDVNWNTAVSNGWISDFLFGWSRISQSYNFANSLIPGEAYWLYSYQTCSLKKVI